MALSMSLKINAPNPTKKVISQKKVKSNKENAKSSTGPTSPEGKERSRRNATKHGLLTKNLRFAGKKIVNADSY